MAELASYTKHAIVLYHQHHTLSYLILSLVNCNDKYQLSYGEANAQVDVDVIPHTPQ